MAYKWIFLASFATMGSLFYLSKSGTTAQPAKSVPVIEDQPAAPEPRKPRRVKVASKEPEVGYAEFLPVNDGRMEIPRPKILTSAEFYAKFVRTSIYRCRDELYERRRAVFVSRGGDAEVSFNGELLITASFEQEKLASLQSRSHEIRDLKFHNCIETAARTWPFPPAIVQQGQWSHKQTVAHDARYRYLCKETVIGKCLD